MNKQTEINAGIHTTYYLPIQTLKRMTNHTFKQAFITVFAHMKMQKHKNVKAQMYMYVFA